MRLHLHKQTDKQRTQAAATKHRFPKSRLLNIKMCVLALPVRWRPRIEHGDVFDSCLHRCDELAVGGVLRRPSPHHEATNHAANTMTHNSKLTTLDLINFTAVQSEQRCVQIVWGSCARYSASMSVAELRSKNFVSVAVLRPSLSRGHVARTHGQVASCKDHVFRCSSAF